MAIKSRNSLSPTFETQRREQIKEVMGGERKKGESPRPEKPKKKIGSYMSSSTSFEGRNAGRSMGENQMLNAV